MKAKEYFEGIRSEVVKTERAREMLERMRAKEGAKAQSYQPLGGGGYCTGASLAIIQRIDFEKRLERRIADARKQIDEACEVLYGIDGRGGLAKLKGTRYADAICMGYLQAQPWSEIAEIMQSSQQWCRKLCDVGFAYIDAVGWAKLKNA
ncbi:hypothetical protein [Collinsella stercoris]|uniref:hypothetical protein n=1 Tax=Collinsella stercoris TaxID=147206 RepID=UPI00059134F2|nr:hypothetical protein [Collinsella stercoris]UEA45193.1 hypothetical protein LK434_08675 [Collinsella stercoris DSM 13279]UWP12282.1 hypothetical protein NQ498_03355 [Collinsella stercoris]